MSQQFRSEHQTLFARVEESVRLSIDRVLSVVTTQWCNMTSPCQCHFSRFNLLSVCHCPPTVSMEVKHVNHRRMPCSQVLTFWWMLQAGSWIMWPEALLTYQNWGQLVEVKYMQYSGKFCMVQNFGWSFKVVKFRFTVWLGANCNMCNSEIESERWYCIGIYNFPNNWDTALVYVGKWSLWNVTCDGVPSDMSTAS